MVICVSICIHGASLVAQMAKNMPAMHETQVQSLDQEDLLEKGRNGNSLHYSCLGNPIDRGDWWATVHGVEKEMDTTEWLTHTSVFRSFLMMKYYSIAWICHNCWSIQQNEWIFGCFYVLVTMGNTAINIHVQVLFEHVFISLDRIPRNGIAKSYDTSLFDFLRNYLAVFQNGCTIFHITMSHVGEFQFFLIPINICHAPSFLSQSFYWMWNIIDCGFDSSTLAWKIPWTEEPSRLQSMGSLRVRYDWATSLSLSTFMHWRRKWQPTPVFLPGESQGRGSLVGCRSWGRTESDTTEAT